MSVEPRPLRVAALTGGRHVPSARFRVSQYAAVLASEGVVLEDHPSMLGSYPPVRRWLRPAWLGATLVDRVPDIVRTHRADVTLLQREMVSTLATLEGLTRRPRVLDVDDAVWLLRGGAGIRRVAAWSDAVICGNDFLADYFRRHHARVDVLPTAVDIHRFHPAPKVAAAPVIGWSGTSGGFSYLRDVEPALAAVLAARPAVRLRVIADRAPVFDRLDPRRVDYVRWSPASEVAALQDLTVGIMPLRDGEWERGKCSYKMLLYMACGLPVVTSPVGMNVQVLSQGTVGYGARTVAEWTDALLAVVDDPTHAARLGAAGRAVVERHYSVERIGSRLAAHLRAVAA